MLLNYKNEIIILYNGGCCNRYFETERSGGNDEQNKLKFFYRKTKNPPEAYETESNLRHS